MSEKCKKIPMLRTTRASAERSELIQRLDSFIEYATQTRKYQDLDLYEKVKAYIESAPRDDVWQPIETAPKDGTVVDFWHSGGFRVPDNRWVQEWGFWEHEDSAFGHIYGIIMDDITHWMPRPGSPK